MIERRSWRDIPLWPHQVKAVESVRNYIEDFPRDRQLSEWSLRSALVRMPTGTGKSGVIAVLARCFDDTPVVLVVSPWKALRKQLADDIEKRFWSHLDKKNPELWPAIVEEVFPCHVRELFPSTVQECLEGARRAIKIKEGSKAILACTVQALQTICNHQETDYDALSRFLSLVIVDEGHREPAPEWSRAVRGLGRPTVLFTATPYRNDLKMFNVDPRHAFTFSHQDALKGNYIRDIEFHEESFRRTPSGFVNALLKFYDGEYQKYVPVHVEEPRVIIRCNTDVEINHISNLLKRKKRSVVAVHDRFSDSEEDFRKKSVPDPAKVDATFWVHQFKLIEGLDDRRFCLLAVYQPLRNARAVVQQIGRILRNPDGDEGQTAYVFSHEMDRQRAYWDGYIKYERIFTQHPEKYEPRQLFDTIIQIQPEYQYFEGNFRQRFQFDLAPGELHRQFAYRQTTNVYVAEEEPSMMELAEGLHKDLAKHDRDVREVERPDDDTFVFVYQTYRNSPILLHHALAEYGIGFTICHRYRKYLFYYDSAGTPPYSLKDNYRRVPPSRLETLFRGESARISQISLLNSDLGRDNFRGRTLRAYAVGGTAPGLADHVHFPSAATGYTEERRHELIRRYVGFTSARVTDRSIQRLEYDDYISWLHSIARALDRKRRTVSVFHRYARHTLPPSDPAPQNILLDLDEVMEEFVLVARSEEGDEDTKAEEGAEEVDETLLLEERCYPVKRTGDRELLKGKFDCIANSREFEVDIRYDKNRRQYRLSSRELEKAYVKRDTVRGEPGRNLIAYLNYTQAFRVVPKSPGIIYAHSYFYKPELPLWGRGEDDQFDLLRILYPTQVLGEIASEKGSHCPGGKRWEKCCLFYLIDQIGESDGLEPGLGDIDILICDDMGTEIADFIAASTTQRRVMFIHAKAFSEARLSSASALQDVCAQAKKNLDWVHPYSQSEVPNIEKWDSPWDGGKGRKVDSRIRRGEGNGTDLWRVIREIIRDPSATREVWIVLGQGFSREAFDKRRRKRKPPPETVQILFLLQSTWGAVSSVGAQLRVYCSP